MARASAFRDDTIGAKDPQRADLLCSYLEDAITTLKDCRPHSQTLEEFRDALANAEARVADIRNAWIRAYSREAVV